MDVRRALRGQRPGTLALLGVLVALAPTSGFATERCASQLGDPIQLLAPGDDTSGIGGTGVAPDESGIGGTGVDPGDSGIGGTGFGPENDVAPPRSEALRTPRGGDDDSGIGGTGRGPSGVGLFGRAKPTEKSRHEGARTERICVGGLEIAIPENLALESSGGDTGARSIAAGQLVFAEVSRASDGFVAKKLVLAADGAGRIEQILEDGLVIVGGHRVRLRSDTVRDPALSPGDLSAGRWITYGAQLGPDGELVATRIGRGRPGVVRAADTTLEARLGNRLSEARRAGRIDYVSIEGLVGREASRPRVGRIELALPPSTNPRILRPGAHVRIGGEWLDRGALRPALPPRPGVRPAPRPGEVPPSPRETRPTDAHPDRTEPIRPNEVRPPARPHVRPEAPDVPRPDVRPKMPTVDRIRR